LPANGDTDVPTDVVPFYDSNRVPSNIKVVLTSSTTGTTIRATPSTSQMWTTSFTPERALEPSTKYTLHGTWDSVGTGTGGPTSVDLSLEFTTGAGPYEGLPPPPAARIQHYQITGAAVTSCSPPQTGSCISYPDGLAVDFEPFVAGSDAGSFSPPYLFRESFLWDLSGIMQGTPDDCVRLKARAPNGKLSAPTVLCRNDGPLVMLTGSDEIRCTSQGIEHDGMVIPPIGGPAGGSDAGTSGDDPGSRSSCAIGHVGGGGANAAGVLAAISLLFVSRRRAAKGRNGSALALDGSVVKKA
jgi:hypothetical protein